MCRLSRTGRFSAAANFQDFPSREKPAGRLELTPAALREATSSCNVLA